MTTTGMPDDCGCGSPDAGLPCGCCKEQAGLVPQEIANPPALSRLGYRVGTYATFRETMVRRIPATAALQALTTRRDDDFAIALLDMWAYVGDVLTFYQERYANEAFLRTATQRDNVLRLAAILDYRPSPGAAAVAWLAFTADKDKQVALPAGLRVASVPGQDEKPQKFETIEALVADASLNRVRVFPKPASHTALKAGGTRGVLDPRSAAATLARVKPGDRLLLRTASGVEEKEVASVDDDPLEPSITWTPAATASGTSLTKVAARFRLFGSGMPTKVFTATAAGDKYTITEAAPLLSQTSPNVDLDGVYDGIPVGAPVLFVAGSVRVASTVESVTQETRTNGPLSTIVTRVKLANAFFDSATGAAVTTISNGSTGVLYLLDGPPIPFATKAYHEAGAPSGIAGQSPLYVPLALLPDRPLGQAASASRLQQARAAPPQPRELLAPGRRVILDDASQRPILATIAQAKPANVSDLPGSDHVELTLEEPLPRALDGRTATMLANVAKGTHGETVRDEVLGDGDATRTFQRFKLSKSPLTFVPAPGSPGGVASTLEVDVGRIEWAEVDTLLLADGNDEVHVSRLQADGSTVVEFGDGEHGSRLPTGRKSVTATYRMGLGKAGNVPALSLRTALDKPVGLKGVTNPAGAEGGADAETMEVAREAAPGQVRTFGRVVSLRDFQDAALEYAGVTKAKATWGWQHGARTVFLTVGGDPDAPLGPETLRSLAKDIDSRRDATARVVIQPYAEVAVLLQAAVVADPRRVPEDVVAAVRRALADALAYEARGFGQSVNLSDLYRAIQQVPGVVAARIEKLRYKREADRVSHGVPKRPLNPRLPVKGTELAAFEEGADVRVRAVPDLAGEPQGGDDE